MSLERFRLGFTVFVQTEDGRGAQREMVFLVRAHHINDAVDVFASTLQAVLNKEREGGVCTDEGEP